MKDVGSLIRGELAAVRSLDQVLKSLRRGDERRRLRWIREDHAKALDVLKRFAPAEAQRTEGTGGPWAQLATAVVRGASVFGNRAALRALKLGEEFGVREYQEALREENIDFMVRDIIRAELLPRQERHLEEIERFLH